MLLQPRPMQALIVICRMCVLSKINARNLGLKPQATCNMCREMHTSGVLLLPAPGVL